MSLRVANTTARLCSGAIDNSPDGEGKSPEGGKLVNYVDGAISAIRSGAKVSPAETKAYGCGVKYQTLGARAPGEPWGSPAR